MKWLDNLTTQSSRTLAQRTSRRSLLTRLGTLAVGAASIPLLPVARAAAAGGGEDMYPGVATQSTGNPEDPGNPASCDYWRYCAIDGYLCSCCGGTQNSCPPGTEMSPLTWIGTCLNPADNVHYIISYNDCCGLTSCARCLCNRNENDTPLYRAQTNNDTNWCLGTESSVYTCSTAVILGVSIDQEKK
jgi:methylamine dehydrogenase light chain